MSSKRIASDIPNTRLDSKSPSPTHDHITHTRSHGHTWAPTTRLHNTSSSWPRHSSPRGHSTNTSNLVHSTRSHRHRSSTINPPENSTSSSPSPTHDPSSSTSSDPESSGPRSTSHPSTTRSEPSSTTSGSTSHRHTTSETSRRSTRNPETTTLSSDSTESLTPTFTLTSRTSKPIPWSSVRRRPTSRIILSSATQPPGTSSSDAPESTADSTASSSSDPPPSSSSDAPMTTHMTSMHDTTSLLSSHVMTETPTSTSHSMVESSTTQNDPTTSSGAGPSSTRITVSSTTQNTVSSTTQNVPSSSTRPPSEPSSTRSTTTPADPTSSPISRTTTTTTPQSTTPLPTSRSTSDAVSTPPPSSSSDTPSTSSSPLTTTTPPPPISSTSSSGGSTTSITTPASSSSPTSETTPISTDPVSTPPASSSSDPPPSSSAAESSSSSETQTISSATTPPATSSSAEVTSNASTARETSIATSSSANPVVTSGSIILSSASDVQVSFTTTNSLGQTTLAIPSLYTTTYTSTSNGVALTITAVVSQATTLNTDGGGSTSPFFKNKGAVAGVFIVVGIAGAAIILFGIFTYLRRRKMRRLTREAAIAATLGSGRTPFVDDDDADGSGPSGGNSTEMGYHSASETRPVYGTYGTPYGAAGSGYGYGPDPFYSNPPAGKSFNASPPGSMDHHGPAAASTQGLLGPALNSYGPTGAPNLPPTTPLLAIGNQGNAAPAAAPASPPSVYSNTNAPKGYEYDYSNFVPPSAVDNAAGRTLSPSPTSPTFSKRSSLPPPPPGAAVPNYTALAAAAGLVSDSSGPLTTNIPPSAYQGAASNKARRSSNTPSFASSASRYSVETPAVDSVASRSQLPGLPTYSVANASKSQSAHSFNATSSNHSHGGPLTPGADALLVGDRGGLIRSPSGGSDWRAGRPKTPLVDHRLDPDTILAAKGRSPGNANRLSDYSTPSEESLGSLQDHEDYSRRVLQLNDRTLLLSANGLPLSEFASGPRALASPNLASIRFSQSERNDLTSFSHLQSSLEFDSDIEMASSGNPTSSPLLSSGPIPKAILYYHPKDPWSSAVLLALEEKGYGHDELDRKEVDITAGDNYDLAYLRINNSVVGTGVPTLVVPLDRYLGPEIESKYKALSDVSKILEFLDKSRPSVSKSGIASHSPAPALAPATIDAQIKSNSIISLVHSTPLDLEVLFLAGKTPDEVAEMAKGEQGTWLKRRAEKLAAALDHDPTAASPDPNNPAPVLTAKSRALLEPRLALYKAIIATYDSPTSGDSSVQEFFSKSKIAWEVDVKTGLESIESTIKQSHVASGEEGLNATNPAGMASQGSTIGHTVTVPAANAAAAEAESHNREAGHPGGLLLGEQLSLADLHLFVWLARAVYLSRGDLSPAGIDKLGERAGIAIPSRVKAFWEAMVQRESVKKVYHDGAH